MRILLDTNVLLRTSEPNHPHHPAAIVSVQKLVGDGRPLCISSQTIYEFLAVATRAIVDRGLGMRQADADLALSRVLVGIDVLYDSPLVVEELRRLMVAQSVVGKSIHDTRLVATMLVNRIAEILTFNGSDFAQFTQIVALDPSVVSTQQNP